MIYYIQGVNENKPRARYRYGHPFCMCLPTPTDAADALLRQRKKDANALYEEMLAAKKSCEKARDIEGARAFRELASDALKQYRAICLVGPWFMSDPLPGDCRDVVSPYDWPVELSSEIDITLGAIELFA